MGMWIFLASLAVLFIATIIGFVVMRQLQPGMADLDLPRLPRTLWLSTGLLIASSGTMHLAWWGARRGRHSTLRLGLGLTTGLGLAFMLTQGYAWVAWYEGLAPVLADIDVAEQRFSAMAFYVLTGIHAAHVVGGLVPLTIVTARSFRRIDSAMDRGPGSEPEPGAGPAGVIYVAMYWHFLDAVWVVLFLTLLLGG